MSTYWNNPPRARRRETPAWYTCAPPGHIADAEARAEQVRAEREALEAMEARRRPSLPRNRADMIAELRRRQGLPNRPQARDAISFGNPERMELLPVSARGRAEALAGTVPDVTAHIATIDAEGTTLAVACPYCAEVHERIYAEIQLPRTEQAACGWGEYRITSYK